MWDGIGSYVSKKNVLENVSDGILCGKLFKDWMKLTGWWFLRNVVSFTLNVRYRS